MPLSTLLPFVAALAVALAVPGPDLVLVVQSSTHSLRRGFNAAGGIIAGLCLHALLATAGLAALLASAPGAMLAVRLVGSVVLLWLGVSMLRSSGSADAPTSTTSESSGFLRGFFTNATNPKALLFFSAVLPQFIGTGPGIGLRTAVLAGTVVVVSSLWWAGAIALIRVTGIGNSAGSRRLVTRCGGIILILIALVFTGQLVLWP